MIQIVFMSVQCQQQLLANSQALSGLRLSELAQRHAIPVPDNLRRHKGWIGQLIETALGAEAGNLAMPDFPSLGIELKTLPIDDSGKPLESTFVCTISLQRLPTLTWQSSLVRCKLAKVLFVPVVGNKSCPPGDRLIATPFLWQMSGELEQVLQQDWQELTNQLCLGQLESVTARLGQYLQVRPKAANGTVLTTAYNSSGEEIQTLPRGFYLRPSFTQRLLDEHFA